MNDIEKMKEVIRRAIKGGWEGQLIEDTWTVHPSDFEHRLVLCIPRPADKHVSHIDVAAIIYSHNFAMALFGNTPVDYYDIVDLDNGGHTKTVTMPMFHYHLKQAVVSENTIHYMWEHSK